MSTKFHILFLTTSSLATNPRLVKEFEFLKAYYNCSVVCFEHQDWSLEPSKKIIENNSDVNFVIINRNKELLSTLVSKGVHKMAIISNALFKNNVKIAAYASNDKTYQLLREAKKQTRKQRPDRVIAHNLGAFYPALKISKKYNAKLQIDVEDYHPGEDIYFNHKFDLKNRLIVMQHIFDQCDLVTFASEGIRQKSESVFDFSDKTNRSVIINAFKETDFVEPTKTDDKVNLVWFSQNISAKRGLEEVFAFAKNHRTHNVHLIGKTNPEFLRIMQPTENVKIHQPMSQDKLYQFLSKMDVGLALERKDTDGNRDICLTNKFLAYAQAGLYILATDTFGQKHFLNAIGTQFGEIITTTLEHQIKNLDVSHLSAHMKQQRWKDAKAFSWEVERKKLLDLMT